MEEDNEYTKLPVEERCVHKVWKARLNGYEEVAKIFRQIDDEKSSDWNKYIPLIKKFVVDTNAPAQEKGLEAVLAFVENCGAAGKTVTDVMTGMVQKCVAAAKAKTKDLALQICLMYIEIEKQEVVIDELLKGTENKNPKIISACVSILTQSLKYFGPKIVNINKIMKRVPSLLEEREAAVRSEAKILLVEIFRWLGQAIRPSLSALKQVQLADVEPEFEKVKNDHPRPSRLIRSQQAKKQQPSEERRDDIGEDGDDGEDGGVGDADPYDLLEPVDVLGKLPKDFYTQLEAKKWSDRKESLEVLEKVLSQAPKIDNGDYGDLIRALKKIIVKDSNVVVVQVAIKCISGLANGLKKKFHTFAGVLIPCLLEKFKEKKQNIVIALREAVDAIYPSTTLEQLLEDILIALDSKNPAMKAETVSFVARCFTKCTSSILNKKLLKALSPALLKALNESDPVVRDNAAVALGTAMKVVGEKGIAPYLGDLDNVKMAKVKECCDKAELVVKQVKKSAAPRQTPAANVPTTNSKQTMNSSKKPIDKSKKTSSVNSTNAEDTDLIKKDKKRPTCVISLNSAEARSKAETILPAAFLGGIRSKDSTERQKALKQLDQIMDNLEKTYEMGLVLLHIVTMDFSLKNADLPSLVPYLQGVKSICSSLPIPNGDLGFILIPLLECLQDSEKSDPASECLMVISQATSFDSVIRTFLDSDIIKGNPKLWSDALNWVSHAMMQSGSTMGASYLMEEAKKAFSHADSLVRNAGLALIGTMHLHTEEEPGKPTGDSTRRFPEKGVAPKQRATESTIERGDSNHDFNDKANEIKQSSSEESIKRIDISTLITEQLIAELGDKSWKVRAEALNKLSTIVKDAGKITPDIGDTPQLLVARIADSNTKISVSAVAVVELIATAIGPPVKQHTRIFLPALLRAIGDSKPWVRAAVLNCINVLGNVAGYKEFFEGEIIAEALKSSTTTVRIELWAWLAEKMPTLKSIPKDELMACLPMLFSNLEDRSAEVRKTAGEAVLGFMIHLGYSTMAYQAENMKNGGGVPVKAALEKARAVLPEKPKQKVVAEKTVRPLKMVAGSSATIVKSSKAKPSTKGSSAQRKKEEDVDNSPLLQVNNLKHQRVIDEQKMKTLRWNFSSPRPEFVELLRDQMISANLNKTLIGNMFHVDFKYHLRAIEALTEDLSINRSALMSNLDLILRWMTLRFFDTNPSVLLKGLEYLNSVFDALIEEGYNMLDNEAASFFPYLILKVGDPKDAVRNSVRALFKQIGTIYPLGKQFTYVMEGLKSKNARQRSECLEQLGWLIENYGVVVCNPSPMVALKEIAKHIADRDTSVRNSALNCVVTAYFLEGEKILKMVGQISEKDMTLLEERIKRAAKNRPVASVKPLQASPPPSPPPQQEMDSDHTEEEIEHSLPPQPISHSRIQHGGGGAGSGPYGLDPNVLDEIECAPVHFQAPKLVDIDLQFLKDPATQTTVNPIQMPKVTPSLSKFSQPTAIKWELTQIASNDIEKAMSAMAQIDTVLNSDKRNHMMEFVDYMVNQLVHQLIILNQSTHPDLVNCYRANFSLLMKLCNYQELCHNISEQTLYKVLEQLLLLITEHRFETMDRNEMFIKVVNSLVIRLLESSNKTNMLCALVKMLYDTVKNTTTSKHHQELVIKCLWKLNRTQPEWDSEVQYVRVLTEIHCFLRDYPTVWWKNQADVPLRTIKTMLHSMVKIRGTEVKDHLKCVHGLTPESEMYNYVRKVIKHLKVEGANTSGGKDSETQHIVQQPTQYRLSKETHDELSEIFKMIGDVEETSEGIRRLFEFKKAHPEADVDPFLSKATPVFQQYIKRGLAALEIQSDGSAEQNKKGSKGEKQGKLEYSSSCDMENGVSEQDMVQKRVLTKEAERLWNRLQLLQEQAGCQSEKKPEKLQDNMKEQEPNICNGDHIVQQEEGSNTQFESIKQRLEYIKSSYKNN